MQLPCTQCKQFMGIGWKSSKRLYGLRNLAQWEGLVSTGLDMFSKGAGGGGQSGGAAPISVATNVITTTQISPQISPVFVQQEKPEGSPVTTGVTQALPPLPVTGAMPGFDTASGYLPTGQPSIPMPMLQQAGINPLLLLAGGGLLLMLLFAKKRKPNGGAHVS